MPTLEVFFDYACPYCLKGHEYLVELAPQYPDITIDWRPCEAHPRPEEHGPHSDLCIRSMFFARDQGVDLWAWHRLMYAACLADGIDIEDAGALAAYAKDLADPAAFKAALDAGQYTEELQRNNDYAYEESGVWAVPSYRMDGRKLDAAEGVGVTKAQLKAFLDGAG